MSLGKCELCNRSSCECVARAQAKAEQRHKNCAWAYREIDTQSLEEASKIASNKKVQGSRDGIWRRKC